MRIGILTHPLENNYGGILQNFALQQVLLRQGHTVTTIDIHPYSKVPIIRMFAGWMNRLRLHYLKGRRVPTTLNPMPSDAQFGIINKHTRQFVRTKIKCTESIRSFEDLSALDAKYKFDAYVIGSDQVWNTELCPWYFGSFIHRQGVKLISYAASFGHAQWKMDAELTAECATLAKKFIAISVREDSAVGFCRKYLGVDATHVIDPTMLLSKDDYLAYVDVEREHNTLFSYILDKDDFKHSIAVTTAAKRDLNIKNCMPEEKYVRGLSRIEDCIYPPVDIWLNGFNNASFVVTDSFHGTVFAIIFNVPFVAIGNRRRGLARFESLLKMFGLEERLVTSMDEAKAIVDTPINFTEVNTILERERKKALEFLSVLS